MLVPPFDNYKFCPVSHLGKNWKLGSLGKLCWETADFQAFLEKVLKIARAFPFLSNYIRKKENWLHGKEKGNEKRQIP